MIKWFVIIVLCLTVAHAHARIDRLEAALQAKGTQL